VGRIVRHALAAGKPLEGLTLEELKKIDPRIAPDVFASLTLEAGLARREVLGGTGPQAVAAAIAGAKRCLGAAGAT
jgi:argininosuccinate lyase